MFVNAFPWLFPGGIGDVYDPVRGKVKDIHQWAKHMVRYQDGRFVNDQLFCLYVFNMLQRHTNNSQGNFFYKNKHFLGASERLPPTVEELQKQLENGDLSYLYKLRLQSKYAGQTVTGGVKLRSWRHGSTFIFPGVTDLLLIL